MCIRDSNRPDIKPEPECMRCRGNAAGCRFCAVRAELDRNRAESDRNSGEGEQK